MIPRADLLVILAVVALLWAAVGCGPSPDTTKRAAGVMKEAGEFIEWCAQEVQDCRERAAHPFRCADSLCGPPKVRTCIGYRITIPWGDFDDPPKRHPPRPEWTKDCGTFYYVDHPGVLVEQRGHKVIVTLRDDHSLIVRDERRPTCGRNGVWCESVGASVALGRSLALLPCIRRISGTTGERTTVSASCSTDGASRH